ncbi:hypothetical protein EV356DRAFT_500126 [Viridothelium virens]|uniref:Uncharacterized protein n=1 Tax=Viridothelium virens TaxID=1048519 RepID=A0A6A6HC32_VIRVR|nr:hypothetical protein EV356DRAFT_500126 [Viridothelium virens]
MQPRGNWPWLVISILTNWTILATAAGDQQPLKDASRPAYTLGQSFEVTCLNRSITTGEHITDDAGNQLYIPFPTCNETGRPLELEFGVEKEINCTIEVTDPLYHLLEFYVHNDAPLTCRIPSRPPAAISSPSTSDHPLLSTSSTTSGPAYIPLIFALTGTLQSSHLHIASTLNLLIHAAPRALAPGVIDAATAYSVHTSDSARTTQIIIGDPLTLQLSVRWFSGTRLPSVWKGLGGHFFWSTAGYCALSAGAAAAVCVVYFRGVELPRRLRSYGRDSVRGERGGAGVGGAYNGYGYGVGNGYGVGVGKRD